MKTDLVSMLAILDFVAFCEGLFDCYVNTTAKKASIWNALCS